MDLISLPYAPHTHNAHTRIAVAIMRGPEAVEPAEKETLGFLLSLLLNLGILIGSQAALVFVNL